MSDVQAIVALFSALSNEHLWCLINCHSYKKFWWYLMFFLQGKCPLCELPEEIYPRLGSEKRRVFKNLHWHLVKDTFAETQGRKETLLIVYKEHVGDFVWNTLFSIADVAEAYRRLELHIAERSDEASGAFVSRLGHGKRSVDTTPDHFNITYIDPDGTEDIYIPVFKGPERQKIIRARAVRFALFHLHGEPAEADETLLEMKYANELAIIYPQLGMIFERLET
jgi:hypothetical protein